MGVEKINKYIAKNKCNKIKVMCHVIDKKKNWQNLDGSIWLTASIKIYYYYYYYYDYYINNNNNIYYYYYYYYYYINNNNNIYYYYYY